MERWALGGRYGGVGRTLHGCGVCDQSGRGRVLPDRSQCLQEGGLINCLEGETWWLHVITIGHLVLACLLACYGIRPREMERQQLPARGASQTRRGQTLGTVALLTHNYCPTFLYNERIIPSTTLLYHATRYTSLFPPTLRHPPRQCWTTSPLSPPRASCSGAAPTPRSPPTSSTA